LGQKQPIDVYNLVCEQGIESRIADLVGNKQAFFKGLFDGDSDTVKFDQSGSFLARVRKLYDPAALAAATAGGGSEKIELPELADVGLDDEASDPFEELIEAGDESQDQVESSVVAAAESAAVPVVAQADSAAADSMNEPSDGKIEPRALPSMGEVRQLFAQLEVRRQQNGRVVIEAPPEAASALSALFEGMATLLQAASRPEN
jgi:hypothetical protein